MSQLTAWRNSVSGAPPLQPPRLSAPSAATTPLRGGHPYEEDTPTRRDPRPRLYSSLSPAGPVPVRDLRPSSRVLIYTHLRTSHPVGSSASVTVPSWRFATEAHALSSSAPSSVHGAERVAHPSDIPDKTRPAPSRGVCVPCLSLLPPPPFPYPPPPFSGSGVPSHLIVNLKPPLFIPLSRLASGWLPEREGLPYLA
ncbi:hypothetical protein TOPH_00088 [Tolypocladium ophioglossoides CBS 100239]|uniref:Uncharacterized protein n=1 Tax=Tolypocladium ophioglossoides (strain CBS 100239) TaxID=1163406 RepID=A0A0L0NKM1_TOLOC|nr:hypothetical protein TOPH_00088 [Tolypocladium ophioglossoides CBS 100239]